MDTSKSKTCKFFHAKDIPCVSQTSEWKGFFEAHFMSGEEIDKKYPILDPRWTYHKRGYTTINFVVYDGYYVAYFNDFHKMDDPYSDPWYRELKHDTPLWENKEERAYHTTIESNAVLVKFIKTKL